MVLGLALAPLVLAARAVRRRFLPSLSGATAGVGEAILVLSAITLVGLVLGIAGLLQRWPLVLGCLALGGAALVVLGRSRPNPAPIVAPSPSTRSLWRRPEDLIAAAAAALVGAPWLAQSIAGLRDGMRYSVDTLWYHGPMSARFAEQGSILAIHHFDLNPVTSYYPGGTSLLHAVGILLLGGDVLSPLVNVGFLVLAGAAGWSIGQRLGSGAAGLLGALVVLGMPMLVGDERYGQPGGEYNDVVGLALVLAAVALLLASTALSAEERPAPGSGGSPTTGDAPEPFGTCAGSRPALLLAGAAAGLAAGTKLSMLAPVGALTIGVLLVAGRGRRWSTIAQWLAAGAATGAFWYIRNVFAAGSPLPGVELPLGPLAPPSIEGPPTDFVARFLLRRNILDGIIVPGLDESLGPAWPVILLIVAIVGCALLLAAKSSLQRMLGAVVLATSAAYLVTPTFIGSPPLLFSTSVRFAIVPLGLGMILVSRLAAMRPPIGRVLAVATLAGLVLATQLDWRALWRAGSDEALLASAVTGVAILGSLLVARVPKVVPAVAVVSCLVAAGGIWSVQRHQPQRRFADGFGSDAVLAPLIEERDARIATQGYFLQYPLYGRDLSNHVQYFGRQDDDGGYREYKRCQDWKRAVNDGDYDFLLVTSEHYPIPPLPEAREMGWADTEIGHGLREIARNERLAASFEIVGTLDEASCP